MENHKIYQNIVRHYEDCLAKYGDTNLGVDWPNQKDAILRYKIMLDVVRNPENHNVTLLDFGCGTACMLEHIMINMPFSGIQYTGLDISEKFVEVATKKFPGNRFITMDILDKNENPGHFDYIVMNGVFTEKLDLSFDDMWNYFSDMLIRIFPFAKKGIAFNVMSKHVEWERKDLFHVPMDLLAVFLSTKISRHYVFRNDYGLYEYTCYVYRTSLH